MGGIEIMKKIMRVEKGKEIYGFKIDDLGNLTYESMLRDEEELIHRELISSKSNEMSLFVDEDNSIYILFKENEDLKCAIMKDKHINIGDLYTYKDGNYRINNARMFIEKGNINILAVLNNSDDKVRDVIIHYVYINEDIKENTVKVFNKDQLYKNYLCKFNKNDIKIFYTSPNGVGKESICFKEYVKQLWKDEIKIMEIYGSVLHLDVKEKDKNLYVAIVYTNYSINVLKLCIYDENLMIQKEKTYYSLKEINDIQFIEDKYNIFVKWKEGEKVIISSSLENDKYIKTYNIKYENLMVCETYEEKNHTIERRMRLIQSLDNNRIEFLDLKDILKNCEEEEKNIICYNKDTLEILTIQRNEKEKIINDMQEKIHKLKDEIKQKEIKVIEMQKRYGDNMIKDIKERYENHILELVKNNNVVDKENKELKENIESMKGHINQINKEKEDKEVLLKKMGREFEKSLMDIEHIKQENHKILEEEENKKQKEICELKNTQDSLIEQIELLENNTKEKDVAIDRLTERLNEKENKGILRKILKR